MALRSGNRFVCISSSLWSLNGDITKLRKTRLVSGIKFEEIVERILKRATVDSHRREKLRSNPKYFRVVVKLKVDSETVDMFHNSTCGYRAQYYHSVNTGERANEYAMKSLTPRVTELLSGRNKRTCPLWLVEQSLTDIHAKIWIHQGLWLRRARNTDQHLFVERWKKEQSNADKEIKKKARWAGLTPGEEGRFDLKGAYFTLEGKPFGESTKPNRGNDIHKYGFT